MGSSSEPGRNTNEIQHEVTLTNDFRISKYLITNAQYADFLNTLNIQGEELYNGGFYYIGNYNGNKLIESTRGNIDWGLHWDKTAHRWIPVTGYENHPIIYVTWYGAKEYANWLGGVLPTEAQWEYACRAGSTNPFGLSYGHSLFANQANFNGIAPYALPNGGIYDFKGDEDHPNTYLGKTSAIGSYPPNAWGIYDMHGNVAEWCNDLYGIYSSSAAANPTGPATGTYRVLRGGAWNSTAANCRSAVRNYGRPNEYIGYDRSEYAGFRVVFEE